MEEETRKEIMALKERIEFLEDELDELKERLDSH